MSTNEKKDLTEINQNFTAKKDVTDNEIINHADYLIDIATDSKIHHHKREEATYHLKSLLLRLNREERNGMFKVVEEKTMSIIHSVLNDSHFYVRQAAIPMIRIKGLSSENVEIMLRELKRIQREDRSKKTRKFVSIILEEEPHDYPIILPSDLVDKKKGDIQTNKKEQTMQERFSDVIRKDEINAQKYFSEIFKDLKVENSKRTSFGEVLFEFFDMYTPLKEENKLEIKKQYGDIIVNIFVGHSNLYPHDSSKKTKSYVILQFLIDKENKNLSIFKVEYSFVEGDLDFHESVRFNYGKYFFKNYAHLKEMISKIDTYELYEKLEEKEGE